jgi:hypothetical protein
MKHKPILCGLFAAALCLLAGNLHGQIELRRVGSQRTKTLPKDGYLYLHISPTGKNIQNSHRVVMGNLLHAAGESLAILPEKEIKWQVLTNGLEKKEEVKYAKLDNNQPINVEIATIEYMYYHSRGKKMLQSAGGIAIAAGIFTSLVLAPLVSWDYGGDSAFAASRYQKVAGYGLAATGLGVAIAMSGKARKFQLKGLPRQARQLWAIEPR